MVDLKINSARNITDITKVSKDDSLFLSWKSAGNKLFLILFSDNGEKINLNANQQETNRKKICDVIDRCLPELISANTFSGTVDDTFYRMNLYSYIEFCQNGGFQIKREPGVYYIYGVDYNEITKSLDIFTENIDTSSNRMTISLDLIIEEAPYMLKKGLFKKRKVYSGYHIVRFRQQNPELAGGKLSYSIKGYTYPVPDSILEHGGTFFVRADESDAISFNTDTCGLQIKVQRKG